EMNRCTTWLLFRHSGADYRHRLDHHRLDRHVLVHAAVGRRHGDDLVDHVHAAHDLAEHGIAVAVLPGVVEELIVVNVDEELRGRGIGIAGARHGERAGLV